MQPPAPPPPTPPTTPPDPGDADDPAAPTTSSNTNTTTTTAPLLSSVTTPSTSASSTAATATATATTTPLGPVAAAPTAPTAPLPSTEALAGPSHPSTSSSYRLSVSVPRDAVGFIIGKRGETVRNMMSKSGAFVAVDRDDTNPNAPSRIFHIEGSRNAVAAARALIKEKVAAVLHGKPNARVHDDVDDDDDDQLSPPLEMWIPKGCVGMIIGHGGQVISEMQDRSGSTIVVHNNKMDRQGAKLLTISGGEREKLHARELIQNVLDRAGMRNRTAPEYHPHHVHDPAPQWGRPFPYRQLQPQLPTAAALASQWYFLQQQQAQQIPFDPRSQLPDFRYAPQVAAWMHPVQLQHHAQQIAQGILAHPGMVTQRPQQSPHPTAANTPSTHHQQQQHLQQQIQQQQQQQQQQQHFQHQQQQVQQQQAQQQQQQQLQAQFQHQQHAQQQQQHVTPQQQPPIPQQHVQRGAVLPGPQMTPPQVNPLYPPSAQVPWSPQLPYHMQHMQVPFDQNMLPTHPMLKLATKAVYVPSSCVGIVIGRSGETIRDLQQRSGAHIKVTPDKDAKDDAPVRVIYISGTPAALDLAHSLVNDVINEGLTRSYRDGVEPRANIDQQEPDNNHDSQYEGEQGGSSGDQGPGQGQGASQQGDDENEGNTEGQSEEQRHSSQPSDAIDYTDSESFPELGAAAKDDRTGGNSSSRARSSSSSSGNNVPEEGNTRENTEQEGWSRSEGERIAQESRDERRARAVDAPPAPFTGEGRVVQRPATNYPSSSISFEMKIPNRKVGVIIGKGGSTIRLLQQKSGARIVVSKKIDRTREDNLRVVTITGPEAFVEAARRLIVQRVVPNADDPSQVDDRDTASDPTDFDSSILSGDPAVDSLAVDLANHSLTSPLPPVIPGSSAPVSPIRIPQTPFGAYHISDQPAGPFVASAGTSPAMHFAGVQQYQEMRPVGRQDSAEFRAMDPQGQQQAQYTHFVGHVAQPFSEQMQVATGFTFPQSPESSETMQQGFGDFRLDQYHSPGANIFGGGFPLDLTGNVLSDSTIQAGQTFQAPASQEFSVSQGFGEEDPVYSYPIEDFNQTGTEPSSTT